MRYKEYTSFYKDNNCLIIYNNKYIFNLLFLTDISELIVWNEVKEFKYVYISI